ncbi:MAG: LCP family protein [Eubacterium sp.]|nr:LCP family protein [Eubacterium sp.]
MAKELTKWEKLKKVRRRKKILITFEALFAAIVIMIAIIWFVPPVKSAFLKGFTQTYIGKQIMKWFGSEAFEKGVFDDEFDKSKLIKNNLKYKYSGEYLNFVLFGVDSRNKEVDTSNSDSILIVSMHNTTGKVKMVSVYRDTMIGIYDKNGNFKEYFKVNSAFSNGGAEAAINTLNKNLDLDLTDYCTVNFGGVARIIDALGGIKVNLTKAEKRQINYHMKSTISSTGKKAKKVKKYGKNIKLNGIQAATYCRIRKATFIDPENHKKISNDFGRAARQRSVMMKLVDAAKKAGVSELEGMVDEVVNADSKKDRIISTSFDFDTIVNMIPVLFDFELNGSEGFPSRLQTGTYDGASYVVPQTLATNVKELHKYLYGEKNYKPTSTVNDASYTITSKTGVSETSDGFDPTKIEGYAKGAKGSSDDYDYDDHWNSPYMR